MSMGVATLRRKMPTKQCDAGVATPEKDNRSVSYLRRCWTRHGKMFRTWASLQPARKKLSSVYQFSTLWNFLIKHGT
jgi:hypothetical protein